MPAPAHRSERTPIPCSHRLAPAAARPPSRARTAAQVHVAQHTAEGRQTLEHLVAQSRQGLRILAIGSLGASPSLTSISSGGAIAANGNGNGGGGGGGHDSASVDVLSPAALAVAEQQVRVARATARAYPAARDTRRRRARAPVR